MPHYENLNLHYSIFLFKLKTSNKLVRPNEIYITVCCYLNTKAAKKFYDSKDIYITVCCYLNCCYFKSFAKQVVFTLQYVSI